MKFDGYREAEKVDEKISTLLKRYPVEKYNAHDWMKFCRTVESGLQLLNELAHKEITSKRGSSELLVIVKGEIRRRHKIRKIIALKKGNGFVVYTKEGSIGFADNKHLANKLIHHFPHLRHLFTLGVLDANELIGRYVYGISTLESFQGITHKTLT